MSTITLNRPDTTMGHALAARALRLAGAMAAARPEPGAGLLDLTSPEAPVVPPHIRDAAKAALDRGETHYTSRPGVPELRQAIGERSTGDGFPATADTVVVTNGGAEALYITLQTVLKAGDRILVPEPIAPNIVEMIAFIGAHLVWLKTDPAARFVPTVEEIAGAEATVLLLTSPSPITGVAIHSEEIARLIAAATERDMTVILDRSLATACYDPALPRNSNPELGARVLTIGSFSTGHGLGGWRVGFFTAPEQHIKELRELKQAMSICTTAVSQFAALAALEGPTDWLVERRQSFATKRDMAAAMLGAAGLTVVAPDAYPALLIDVRPLDAEDRRIADHLEREAGVVVEPGSRFGAATTGFIRVDLGVGEPTLTTGIRRLADSLAKRGQA